MKLHLHFGAHKTATTHLQNVLEVNRPLYPPNVNTICTKEFRNNLRWSNGCVDYSLCLPYLDKIKNSAPTLVISEENLSGETNDIYKQLFLYSDIEKRLKSFEAFTQTFDDIEIWFGIRSMDGFLPSIYCESLRHWSYNHFENVYAKNYTQTWLPVIKKIQRTFPNSRINVIRYENYMSVLPSMIERIFGSNELWNYLNDERPRATMNDYVVRLMKTCRYLIPFRLSINVFQRLSTLLCNKGIGYKFAPFDQNQVGYFLDIYSKDINEIKQLKNVFVY